MKQHNDRQPILPNISSYKSQPKPIKEILKELKEKKVVIETRIKTQMEEEDLHQKDQSQDHLKDRVITQVPFYVSRKSYYKQRQRQNGLFSLDRIQRSVQPQVEDKIEQEDEDDGLPNQSGRISEHNTGNKKRPSVLLPKVSNQKSQNQNSPKSGKELKQKIEQIFVKIPINPKERKQQDIQQLREFLLQNNIFFSKIHNVLVTCLLKLNRLTWVQKNQVLYRNGQQRSSFYIILFGKVKIFDLDKNLKKVCYAGESVGQELIFTNKPKKVVKQTAKALVRSFLIQIKTENYRKMAEQMIRYGYRVMFNQMESMMKRNFITKNWIRGQKARFEKKY